MKTKIRNAFVGLILAMLTTAVFTTSIAAQPDVAPNLINEDFNSGTLPATFEIVGRDGFAPEVVFNNGAVVFNGNNIFAYGRTFLRTVGDDLFGRSFVAEVTVKTGSDISWFGMGKGLPDANNGEADGPAIFLRMHPSSISSGSLQWAEKTATGGTTITNITFGYPGSGIHRLRLTWDAIAQTAVFEVDEDYAGGAFVADYTSPAIDGSDNGFSDLGTRLFFGSSAQGNWQAPLAAEFDNILITVESTDTPPTANAGLDFSVNEGQTPVTLDGSGSTDPDNDQLTYVWTQLSGATVTLSNSAAQQPTFTAPIVALGGETLTFELTVTANGESDTDTVDITVVNVNHPPVAEAGLNQSISEGSPVTLHGEDSFDIDNDPFTYAWVQVNNGSPTVTLSGANTANPTFTAPFVAAGGAPGVVATLVFELTVDDGFPQDAPAPGYSLADVVDTVTVEVTNLNNDPVADAGTDQTVDENTNVSFSGALSSDPDSDTLTYSWAQTGGTSVFLTGGMTVMPSFTTPFVSPGGDDLTFELTVNDGYGGLATDTVVVHVQNANDPPLISAAEPTIGSLWPPNHKMVLIGITGVSDPDNNATITIDAVRQDEPTNGTGDGDTAVDAIINSDGTVLLRAERSGNGNGRVYHIYFTASDLEGSVSGVVTVSVNKKRKQAAVDEGPLYDSTQ